MAKVFIVVGNDGLPRFADPECNKLYVAKSLEAALDTAKDLVAESPYVVFSVYQLVASVFVDGNGAHVVPSDGDKT